MRLEDYFDERQIRLIRNCVNHANDDPAGLPGHNLILIIAKFAELLGVQDRRPRITIVVEHDTPWYVVFMDGKVVYTGHDVPEFVWSDMCKTLVGSDDDVVQKFTVSQEWMEENAGLIPGPEDVSP